MEMFCPECMSLLTSSDGQWATCTAHGGRYRILFCRAHRPLPVVGVTPALAAAGHGVPVPRDEGPHFDGAQPISMCVRHPAVQASHRCALCQSPLCKTCEFPQVNGTYLCPDCVMKPSASGPIPAAASFGQALPSAAVAPAVLGQLCRWHPAAQAVQLCTVCGAAMCATCDFTFPGNVHLCPTCATQPQSSVKGKRRAYLIWSYVLAVWSTLGLAFVFSGALAGSIESEEEQQVLGVAMSLLILVPAIIGTALGGSAMGRYSKPLSTWIATIWNGILVGLFIILCLIGLTMG